MKILTLKVTNPNISLAERLKRIAQNLNYKVNKDFSKTATTTPYYSGDDFVNLVKATLKKQEGYGKELYEDKKDMASANPDHAVTAPGGVLMDANGQNLAINAGYTGKFVDKADFSKYRDAVFNEAVNSRIQGLDKEYGGLDKGWSKWNPETKRDLFLLNYNSREALLSWPKTREAMLKGDLNEVLNQLKDSKAYRAMPRWKRIIKQIARRENLTDHYDANDTRTPYYIDKDDTIGELAKKHGLTLAQMAKYNRHIKNLDKVSLGEEVFFEPYPGKPTAAISPANNINTPASSSSSPHRPVSSSAPSAPLKSIIKQPQSTRASASIATATATPASRQPKNPIPSSSNNPNYTIHTIRKGDTFYGLGKQYGVPYKAIIKANSNTNPNKLQINQKIKIPNRLNKTSSQKSAKMVKEVPMELALDQEKTLDSILKKIYQENPQYFPYGLNRDLYSGFDDVLNLVFSEKGIPIGFAGLQKRIDNLGKRIGYYSIGILPEYRGKGFGRSAVKALLEDRKNKESVNGYKALISKTNVPSLSLLNSLRGKDNLEIDLAMF